MSIGGAFTGAYNSFSGVDIKAVFNEKVFAQLQAISYSITREKAPIYTMGSADPRSFSRGKRGIAGTLIFIMFDRHALLGEMGAMRDDQGAGLTSKFLSDIDDLRPEFTSADPTLVAAAGSVRTTASPVQSQESELMENSSVSVASDQAPAAPWYADQILPFDVTLAAANEYGALAVMRIYGIEILNEGYGVSIDDMQSSQQMTYVARQVIGWKHIPTSGTILSGMGLSVTS